MRIRYYLDGNRITAKEAMLLISDKQLEEAIEEHQMDPLTCIEYMTLRGRLELRFVEE